MSATGRARQVIQALIDAGVHDVVIAPGSRNAPLSVAALDAARAGLLQLHTRIDERVAGFLALGLAKQRLTAAVICTSGTAVANLHPAMMEAAHEGVHLIAVTADRPLRLRGSDANQSTEQVDVFGWVVESHDVDHDVDLGAVVGGVDKPVHLNVRLDDPLLSDETWEPRAAQTSYVYRVQMGAGGDVRREPRRTVVVAGDDAGPPARQWAERSGAPLLAEPSSGSRTGAHALRCYRLLIDSSLGDDIERVVVWGHPTLSRPVSRLLARDTVEVIAMPGRGVWPRRPYPHRLVDGDLHDEESADPAWLAAWQDADRSVSRQLDALLTAEPELTPWEAVGAVSRAVPGGGFLMVGPSSPIRDLDLMALPYPVGERRKIAANRGLSGIDGVVSTAIGMALARDSTRAMCLVGDVTFLHDSNALIIGPGQPVPDLTIVVVNDDGGSIFATLEQGAPEYADSFEQLFGTPHGVDIGSLCAATRTPHLRVTGLPELEQALASPNGGLEVVEVVVRRDNRRELDERIRALRP